MDERIIVGVASFALGALLVVCAPREGAREETVDVMTRNVYVGANIFRIREAGSPEEIPVKVAEILSTVKKNNPPERFEALADEIAESGPHLIGLQEVYTIRAQSPGDFSAGNPAPAEKVLFDYLELLLGALDERGLDYRVASSIENVDVELPCLDGRAENGQPLLSDIRVTDRDVILARGDVETANEASGHYKANASLPIGGTELATLRGFTSVDVRVQGRQYHFVNTHLEADLAGPALAFQSLQAKELIETLESEEAPVIVVGDFNSGPNDPEVEGIVSPYRLFASAGYVDAWTPAEVRDHPGYTCCYPEVLDDPEPKLHRRIDLVWVRNPVAGDRVPTIEPVGARVVGDETGDRTPSGLWPSDHAGVVARIRMGTREPVR